jgi:predicted RND superfamily exporter protein
MGITGISLRTSTVVIFSVSLGLAVDDTIHFVVRYQRERARGLEVSEAVTRTMQGAGRAIVLTTVLLVGGFSIFLLSPFNAVKDIGLLGGVTLFSALLADLVILPAMFRLAPNVGAAPEKHGGKVDSQVGGRQLPVAAPANDARRAAS